MDSSSEAAAPELLKHNVTFVYAFFQAAELEARATERYVLVALGGMYSYLATQNIPVDLGRLAWYAPALVAVFGAIRALGLLLRQGQLLDYLVEVDRRLPLQGGVPGWAQWSGTKLSVLALPAAVFYILLIGLTLFVARGMT